ncbi:MAG: TonB-dependent receptor [Pseudomonadota bacterium]
MAQPSENDSEAASSDDGEVIVYGRKRVITPLPGVGLDESQITTGIQTVDAEDIKNSGAINTTQFLNEQLRSITVTDTAGNPFQQDVNFRGFSASPQIATPQGLSIYFDGIRINEPFGQAVNWDLIPLNVIDSLNVVPGSNPLFGLNTIGGAISVNTKSGFNYPGVDASYLYGSWNRQQIDVTVGAHDDHFAALLAYNKITEDGWRDNSPSELRQFFGRGDVRVDRGSLAFTGMRIDNNLVGNGNVPFGDFKVRPEAVFTSPDENDVSLTHLNIIGSFDVTNNITISGSVYYRNIDRDVRGGDFWDDFDRLTAARLGYNCFDPNNTVDFRADAPNGRFSSLGPDFGTGEPGCAPNAVINNSFNGQEAHGASFQLNWATESNQLILGATFDRDKVTFRQTEQLAYIGPDREVFLDPDRIDQWQQASNEAEVAIAGDRLVQVEQGIDDLAVQRANLLGLGLPPALVDTILSGPLNTLLDEQIRLNDILDGAGGPVPTIADSWPAVAQSILRNSLVGSSKTRSAFIYNVATFFDVFNLSLGLRYSQTEVSNYLEADRPTPLWQFDAQFFETREDECGAEFSIVARFQCTGEKFKYESWNPSVGFSVDATEEVNVFANVSRGARVPTSIELACAVNDKVLEQPDGKLIGCTIPTNLTNDPFLPQVRSTSYELGGRGQLQWFDINWNLAVFQTDLENDILFVSLGRGNRGVFDSFGRTRRRGFELGFNKDVGRFRWYMNYTNLEATFESDATIVNPSNSSSNQGGGIQSFELTKGSTIPGTPRHAFRAGLEFDVTNELTAGLTFIAQSELFAFGNENNRHSPGGNDFDGQVIRSLTGEDLRLGRPFVGDGTIDGFGIFNFSLRYQVTDEIRLSLSIDNLLDKKYATTGNLGLNPFTESNLVPAGARDASGFNFNSFNWEHTLFVAPGAERAAWVSVSFTGDWW